MINVVEKGNALEDLKRVFKSNRESFKADKNINGVSDSKPRGFEKYSEYADMLIRC